MDAYGDSQVRYRMYVLVAAAIVIGIVIGLLLPRLDTPLARMTGRYVASGPAAEALNTLAIDDHPRSSSYRRDAFSYNKVDFDGDGCTVRDDVLRRDMNDVTYTGGSSCHVDSGVLHDPYTGKEIDFVRGKQTSAQVQIDHVVALENAWQSGASKWGLAEREEYGNDMYNLLAVDGPANQEKGSASAAYWLPENRGYRCSYVARQIGVKTKYRLSVTTKERDAIIEVLRSCPSQSIPKH
ncbi:HNH endonuclease family protein [Bifidobacterium bombi]|nr:HNH endonuclease family protein [Bifidobacterium bombi]